MEYPFNNMILRGDRKSIEREDISHLIASLGLLKLQERIAFFFSFLVSFQNVSSKDIEYNLF